MELSKMSAVKLSFITIGVAAIGLAALALLGFCFSSYWQFVSDKDNALARLAELRNEVVVLESELSQKNVALSALDSKWAEYRALTNANALAVIKSNSIQQDIQNNQKQLNTVNEAVASSDKSLAILKKDVSAAESELKDLNAQIQQLTKERDSFELMKSEIEQKRQEHASVLAKLTTTQTSLQAYADDLEKIETQITSERKVLDSVQLKLQNANRQLSAAENAFSVTNALALELTARLNQLKTEIGEAEVAKYSLSNVEVELKKQHSELVSVESKIAEKHQEVAKEISNLGDLMKQIETCKVEIAKLEEQKKSISVVVGKLKEEEVNYTTKAETARQSLNEVERTLKIRAPKEQMLMERLAEVAGEYIATTNNLSMARKDLEATQKDKLTVASSLADANAALASAKDSKQELDANLQKLAVDVAEKEKLAKDLQQKVTDAKAELVKLTAEMSGLRDTEAKLSESIAAKQAVIRKLADDDGKNKR